MPPKKPEIRQIDAAEMFEKYASLSGIFIQHFGQDAQLNLEQLTQLYRQLDASMGESDVQALFGQMDKTASGTVSSGEFLWYIFDMDSFEAKIFEEFKGLATSNVYCRIRPIGTDGHTMGEAVDKQLDGWEKDKIFVKDRHERTEYSFPKQVFGPEATQEETYTAVMSEAFNAWIYNSLSVVLLAYGQTGTGKTHTMFGPRESLSSPTLHPDWGLFPRTVYHCLEECNKWNMMKDLYPVCCYSLRAYAIEFYLATAYNLVGTRAEVQFTPNGEPVGATWVQINSVSDVGPFLDMVAANRTMSATKMNAGSSRSHCALILELVDAGSAPSDPDVWCMKRTLTVLDMAGSERPGRTGGVRMSGDKVYELLSGRQLKMTKEEKIGMEGMMINFELSALKSEIEKASEWNRGKKKYKNNCFGAHPMLRMLGRSLVGEVWMNAIINISQSPQNGWETWFSCEWGKGLAKLACPLKKIKPDKVHEVKKKITTDLQKAKKTLDDTPKGGPASKYIPLRSAFVKQAQDDLSLIEFIEKLIEPQLADMKARA